jgi:chromosomal replication initiator protein
MDPLFPNLNPSYSFDNFVVGPCNLFAHSAAQGVASKPAEMYNPLFIYGGVGLGKTHLMQAIGHKVRSGSGRRLKTLYLSTESFTNELVSSIRNRSTSEFRRKYRNIDVLLVDDIHFIAGKDATQEEFFHTFNALHDRKKQIVISSDRPPSEIATLEQRLVSRFEWGLVASLEPPDFEMRLAILGKKAELCRTPIPAQVLELIARSVKSNIRELEGALTRVVATAGVRRLRPCVEMVEEILGKRGESPEAPKVTAQVIMNAAAEFFGVKERDFASSRRSRSVTFPRQAAMFLCRELTSSSLAEIGRAFGGKDHTTVLYACRKIEGLIESDPAWAASIRQLREQITSPK